MTGEPKVGVSSLGTPMHYSVGGFAKIDGAYVMIDRASVPKGYACPAGHIDVGEDPLAALCREFREETGLEVVSAKLLWEQEFNTGACRHGIDSHYWYVYECDVKGSLVRNERETNALELVADVNAVILEPVWDVWFARYLSCKLNQL
jgi:8-oxo-dGTP pyrophosphatase MutT (NUDIX family)